MVHELVAFEEPRLLGHGHELLEAEPELVALAHAGDELPGPRGLGEELLPPGAGVDLRGIDEGLEVALVEEHAGQAAQRPPVPERVVGLEGDAAVEGLEEHRVAVREALGQPLLPRRGEEDLHLAVVRHPEAGEHPALERALLEHRGAQGVDGGDGSALQDVESGGGPAPLHLGDGGVGPRPLQALPQAQLHRGRRVLGERHRRDLREEGRPRANERLDAVHEERRLARACARLHDEARGEVAAGALASLVVDGEEAHQRFLAWSARCSSGSLILKRRRADRRPLGPQTAR